MTMGTESGAPEGKYSQGCYKEPIPEAEKEHPSTFGWMNSLPLIFLSETSGIEVCGGLSVREWRNPVWPLCWEQPDCDAANAASARGGSTDVGS